MLDRAYVEKTNKQQKDSPRIHEVTEMIHVKAKFSGWIYLFCQLNLVNTEIYYRSTKW